MVEPITDEEISPIECDMRLGSVYIAPNRRDILKMFARIEADKAKLFRKTQRINNLAIKITEHEAEIAQLREALEQSDKEHAETVKMMRELIKSRDAHNGGE